MMWLCMFFQLIFSWMMIKNINSLSSPITPYTNYTYSIELLANTSDLWWTVDNVTKEIIFELHVATIGWIALGISPAGGMPGADIGIGWINQSGYLFFQDRYAFGNEKPIIDNTTSDWFSLQGREQDGWTAIQFKRLLDTCDSMDVSIKSGSNILIFAWNLVDPDSSESDGDITYHEDRRGSRVIPLLSYSELPPEEKFAGLVAIEFRANNHTILTTDTRYYCKVFKVPKTLPTKRHAIAREILIDPSNKDVLHHLVFHECDSTAVFDDNNLPDGSCDENTDIFKMCTYNAVLAWAIGGNRLVEYPEEVGFPMGLDFSIQYYMLQIHYDISRLTTNRIDNSGLRFYFDNKLRQYDLGLFTIGAQVSSLSLAIPPKVNNFIVDSYCPAEASLNNFPDSGLTIISSLPHAHLQGKSIWTKIIRNKTAIQYLFNAESYNFDHQFDHRLPQPIKVYSGDEFATRCVYNTMNKNEITLGGDQTKDEMCYQFVTYYPRMQNLYACASLISPISWQTLMNVSVSSINEFTLTQWLLHINWTSDLATQWQTFYNTASRITAIGQAKYFQELFMASLPTYKDLDIEECENQQTNNIKTT